MIKEFRKQLKNIYIFAPKRKKSLTPNAQCCIFVKFKKILNFFY